MVENIKVFLKKTFPNRLKTSLVIGLITISVITVGTVSILRKTVTIDVDGQKKTVVTYKQSIGQVLQAEDIELTEDDKIEPSVDSKIYNNQQVQIKKAVPVSISIGGQTINTVSSEDTVGELLQSKSELLQANGVSYSDSDIVSPGTDSKIESGFDVNIIKVTEEEVSENVLMPYNTVEKVDNTKDVSYSEVAQAGSEGEKKITYKVVKHDGNVVSKTETSQTPIKDSVDKVVVKGGAQLLASASRGGDTSSASSGKTITAEATAYSGSSNCTTYTGRKAVRDPNGISTIAVDPRVIPLGSLVYIEGYGKAIAADIGTGIIGNKIDVFQGSLNDARAWGLKTVTVTILN